MRHTVQELTKAYSGRQGSEYTWVVATWEWNNGFNLIATRKATATEVETGKVDASLKDCKDKGVA